MTDGRQKTLSLELLENYLYSRIIEHGKVSYSKRRKLLYIIKQSIIALAPFD